jgi:RNA polymerase subunit RPABC4/transcription elongation factor Spt4
MTIPGMRTRGRHACSSNNSARAWIGRIEGVSPTGRKACLRCIVDSSVKVLATVTCGLHNNNSLTDRVTNCIIIIRPPLNGNEAELTTSTSSSGTTAVYFKKDDVTWSQPVSGNSDGL